VADEKVLVTLSKDDELMLLVEQHTHRTKAKTPKLVLKMLALVANGVPRSTACRLLGIKERTAERWATYPWYKQALTQIRSRIDDALDCTYTKVITKAQEAVLDRLEAGDHQVMRDGSIIRKPVSAKDAAIVASISFDKRSLLRGKPTAISESKTTSDRLEELKERFSSFANATEIDDAEYEQVEQGTTEYTEEQGSE